MIKGGFIDAIPHPYHSCNACDTLKVRVLELEKKVRTIELMVKRLR